MPIRRVRVVTTGLAGSPYLSTFYFNHVESTSPASNVGAAMGFMNDLDPVMSANAVMNSDIEVPVLDEVTGDLIDVLTTPSVNVGGANVSGDEWSGKQGLLKLNTGIVVGGRRVSGRLFIPGVCEDAGEAAPTNTYQDTVNQAAEGLVTSSLGIGEWVVWSRKNGTARGVTSGQCAPFWSTLRTRRF